MAICGHWIVSVTEAHDKVLLNDHGQLMINGVSITEMLLCKIPDLILTVCKEVCIMWIL